MKEKDKVRKQMLSEYKVRKIRISVAIVFYNPILKNVRHTLENIKLLSSIDDFEFSFYLIDNASPEQKLQDFLPQKLDKSIHYKLLKKNNGFGAGNNSILDDINSDVHVVMNPDIELKDISGFIRAINFMAMHKEVVLLSPMIRNKSNGHVQLLNRKEPTVFDLLIRFIGPNFFQKRQAEFVKREHGYDHIQIDENATGSFMMIRTKAFKAINGFDRNFFMYFEDTDLTKRLSKRGKVIFFPYLTVIHGWRRENHTMKGLLPMIKSMVMYFNKWGWKWK